jgi:hypothetical protein
MMSAPGFELIVKRTVDTGVVGLDVNRLDLAILRDESVSL